MVNEGGTSMNTEDCKNGDVRYCRNMPAEYIQKLGLSESLAKKYDRPLLYTKRIKP